MRLLGAIIALTLAAAPARALIPPPPPPPVPLSDPAMDARYNALAGALTRSIDQSAAALARGRQALMRIGDAPIGSPEWIEARAAVLQLVASRERDKAALEAIRAFARELGPAATDADRARVRSEIDWRAQFLNDTEGNVSDVLIRLVRRD